MYCHSTELRKKDKGAFLLKHRVVVVVVVVVAVVKSCLKTGLAQTKPGPILINH